MTFFPALWILCLQVSTWGRAPNLLPGLVTADSSSGRVWAWAVWVGLGAGRDLIASSYFLLECSRVPAGLRVVVPAHHTWVEWPNECEVPWWMPDERALHQKLKSACSGVLWNVLKPAVMRYWLVLVYVLPGSAPMSVALLKLLSRICLGSFSGSFLWHDRVNALEMGLFRPSFCPSRAPGNCSVIECFHFWQVSYSPNKYLRPFSVLESVHWTEWRTPTLLEIRYFIRGKRQ